jgi:hypothetical protein
MPDALRRPPTIALIASLCMFALGSSMGGLLIRFQDGLYDSARREVVKRPDVHGFAGVEVIDEARIAEIVEQSNNALRMLHVHGLGLGMLILLVSLSIVNLPIPEPLKQGLCVLVSLGALYPPGWLALGWLIPTWGLARLRGPVEWMFFVPFGGAAILAIWGTLACYVVALLRGRRLAVGAFLFVALAASDADAHLFHKMYEPPENQLTRDTRLLQLILDDPAERFDLARQVWDGTTRVRVKPGGFRKWLVRPGEPGMVFKGDYQVHRSSGSLKAEAARIDQRHGTALAARIDAGLAQRNRDHVKTALREMYVVLLRELLEAVWVRLDDVETTERLYPFVLRYYAVNLQGHLNMRDPGAAAAAEATLAALARALGDSETGAPPAPEVFARHRARLVRVLADAVPRA